MTERRRFLKAGAALAAMSASAPASADMPAHLWQGHDFGPGPRPRPRLHQGPFDIDQDEGWYTTATTTLASGPVRNWGLGLVGYTFEENGPAVAVREGRQSSRKRLKTWPACPSWTCSTCAATGAMCRTVRAASTSTPSGS